MKKLIVLLLITFGTLSTAWCQGDTICLPIDKAKELTKLAAKGKMCDSLLMNRQDKIDVLEIGIGLKNEQLRLCDEVVNKQARNIERLTKSSNRNKVFAFGFAFVSFLEAMALLIILT